MRKLRKHTHTQFDGLNHDSNDESTMKNVSRWRHTDTKQKWLQKEKIRFAYLISCFMPRPAKRIVMCIVLFSLWLAHCIISMCFLFFFISFIQFFIIFVLIFNSLSTQFTFVHIKFVHMPVPFAFTLYVIIIIMCIVFCCADSYQNMWMQSYTMDGVKESNGKNYNMCRKSVWQVTASKRDFSRKSFPLLILPIPNAYETLDLFFWCWNLKNEFLIEKSEKKTKKIPKFSYWI